MVDPDKQSSGDEARSSEDDESDYDSDDSDWDSDDEVVGHLRDHMHLFIQFVAHLCNNLHINAEYEIFLGVEDFRTLSSTGMYRVSQKNMVQQIILRMVQYYTVF